MVWIVTDPFEKVAPLYLSNKRHYKAINMISIYELS